MTVFLSVWLIVSIVTIAVRFNEPSDYYWNKYESPGKMISSLLFESLIPGLQIYFLVRGLYRIHMDTFGNEQKH